MAVLSPDEVAAAVSGLDGWGVVDGQLQRELRLSDFRSSVAFVVRIAFEAEAANHHPDIDIRYNRVLLRLSTHSEGGLTSRDVDLARKVDSIMSSTAPGGGNG